jgi:hypothetical protein
VNTEEIIISAVRIAGALPVLWWAFAGALLAIAVDVSDLFQMNLLDLGGVRNYQALDKWLDLSYLATFLIVALRWRGPVRTIAVVTLAYRLVGVALFEVVGERDLLLFFPNVFEFWFLFVAGVRHYRPGYELTAGRSLKWLVPLAALKEAHEYVLHGARWLDKYVAVDLVVDWWRWLTSPFG